MALCVIMIAHLVEKVVMTKNEIYEAKLKVLIDQIYTICKSEGLPLYLVVETDKPIVTTILTDTMDQRLKTLNKVL
jgi:hypothetical protein